MDSKSGFVNAVILLSFKNKITTIEKKSNKPPRPLTYSELLKFNILIFSHCQETFQIELIQQNVDRNSTYGRVYNFFEYIDVSEHVHHNGNDL